MDEPCSFFMSLRFAVSFRALRFNQDFFNKTNEQSPPLCTAGLGPAAMHFIEITIVFKAEAPSGLLLYNAYEDIHSWHSTPSSSSSSSSSFSSSFTSKGSDFISLSLNDSFIEFRFDLGTGSAVLRSRRRISLGKWHSVLIARSGKTGTLRVDGVDEVHGTVHGACKYVPGVGADV